MEEGEKECDSVQDSTKSSLPRNTHLVIDSNGVTRAAYHKLHLFDLEIPGKVRLMESEFSAAGNQVFSFPFSEYLTLKEVTYWIKT